MITNNIQIVGSSEDGDKIFCTYKMNGLTVLRGMYDFDKGKFIILNFYKSKMPDNMTPLKILMQLKEQLDIEYDWNLSGIAKITTLIENGTINGERRKRKRHKIK